MTTLAYRDGVLAADTGICHGDARSGHMSKIFRSVHGLAAASGEAGFIAAFLEWARNETGAPPACMAGDKTIGSAFIARSDGRVDVFDAGGKHTLRAPFFAMGSGSPEARGAMQAGATAAGAIAAAMALDLATFGDIEACTHENDVMTVGQTPLSMGAMVEATPPGNPIQPTPAESASKSRFPPHLPDTDSPFASRKAPDWMS